MLRRLFSLLLCCAMLAGYIPAPAFAVAVETNAPVINCVSVDKTQIVAGESITVTMDVTDESELEQVYVTFDTPNEGVVNMIQVTLSLGEDGLYSGALTTDNSFVNGTYYAYYIVAQDIHGNREQINTDRSVCFELVSDHSETNAPVINSVSLDKKQIFAGESVTVTMDVTDESELSEVRVTFETPFAGVTKMVDVPLSKTADGLYVGTLTTDETYPCGTYYAYYIVAQDVHGNREQINSDTSVCFELVSSGVETNAPVINSVTLDKAKVTAGETVTVTADISDESDLSDVHVFFDTPLAGSFNDILVHLTLEEDGLYRGTLTTDETLPNGNYYLDACVAIDIHGNRTQVNNKMGSFELSGGYMDTTAPIFNSVTVNKSAVAAGETVTVTADITDESDLSDVHVFFDTPLAGSFNDILVHLTLEEDGLYRGTLTTDETLPNGNYYLDACVAIDIHGNRTQINNKMGSFELFGGHTEVNAPVINSVTLDKAKVAVGETVTVTADITDESDLSDVHVFFDTPLAGSFNDILVHLTLEEDGLYRGTLTMDETFPNGNYYVDAFVAIDVHRNRTQTKVESVYFEFGVSKIETNAPVIHSVSADKTQVVIGESVTVTMDVTDESELDLVYVTFDTPHAGVAKMIRVDLTKGDDGLYRGTLTTDDAYPYGTYYAYYIVAQDVLGNREQINSDSSVSFELVCSLEEHIWDEGIVTKESAEEEPGIRTYTCTVCGTTKTEEIAALNHVHEFGEDGKCECGVAGGACGDNLTWCYEPDTKMLTISGTGTMWDFEVDKTPWDAYTDEIRNLVVEESVQSIGKQALRDCGALEDVSLPQGFQVIGEAAFLGCYSLGAINFPDTLTTLADQAFYQCHGLKSVYIPASVTSIGAVPFGLCDNLTKLVVDPGNPVYCSEDDRVLFNKDKTVLYQMLVTASGAYAVPDSVTSIQRMAFSYCGELTEIMIPDGVTAIGDCAFYYCSSLENIQLPAGLTRLENAVLSYCRALKSITVPESVTYLDNSIFACSDSLSELIFEGSAPAFSETSFSEITATAYYPADDVTWTSDVMQNYGGNITWVAVDIVPPSDTCGDNLTWEFDETTKVLTISGIGPMRDFTMDGDWYLAKATDTPWRDIQHKVLEVVIESGVTTVGRGAFAGMEQLIVVSLPNTLTSIGDFAFHADTSLKALDIPDGVTYLGKYALCCCPNLVTVSLPNGITEISTSLFDQTWPNTITIPAGVTTVGSKAFANGTIGEIVFTGNAPAFAEDAFHNQTTTVWYPSDNATWTDAVRQNYGGTITWSAVDESVENPESDAPVYTTASGTWGNNINWNLDANGLLTISGTGVMERYDDEDPNFDFSSGVLYPWQVYASGITKLVVENGITALNNNAFSRLPHLESVILPDSLTDMQDNTFTNCFNLKDVILGSGVTRIGQGSFDGCTALTCISIPSNVRLIDYYAFDGCTNLKDVTISEGVTVIWKTAFRGCTALTSIELPSSVESIGASAFEGCTGLTEITLPANLLTLDKHVFYNCSNLKTLYFEGDVVDFDPYALLNLTATAYYPSGNSSWTSDRLQNYGGNITWVPHSGGTIPITGIPVDEANFPDDNFRAWILTQDYGTDAWLTSEELADVTQIDVSEKKIKNLTGIEHFSDLQYLFCYDNQLSSLDVSRNTALINLTCAGNQLASLNVGNCTALTELNCHINQLTTLDLTGCTALKQLNCDSNLLTSLDVSKNTTLSWLNCGNNQLTELDLRSNKALAELTCCNNQLTNIDVSNCAALTFLDCSNNQLTSLDVCKNTTLTSLFCYKNQLKELDMSGNTALVTLHCYENQLTKLIIRNNAALESLGCDENQLTELDVSQNTELRQLACGINQIEKLDVRNCIALEYLECDDNLLTELDLTQNTALEELSCDSNLLTVLDLSKNTKLKGLQCCSNQLASLDLSNNPACTDIMAHSNRRTITLNSNNEFDLTELSGFDVSKASKWTGGTVNNGVLTALSRTITYSYQINSNETVTFTLMADNYDPNAGKMEGWWGGLYWKIDETGKLTISGTGEMLHYTDPNGDPGNSNPPIDGYPWHRFAEFINSIEVEEGVTTLAEIAFHGLDNLQSVKLPSSLITISDAAFIYCPWLESITIPVNVANLGKEVFIGSNGFHQITFTGKAPTFNSETFGGITAIAYYPAGDDTWTEEIMQDYGGDITWICADCRDGHSFGEWITEGNKSSRTCTLCGYTEHKVNTDSGDVELEIPEQPDLEVEVDPVLPSEDNYILVEEALDGIGNQEQAILKVFDINLKNSDGVHVQPNGTVKVKLPLDWSKNGNYKVYRVNDDGTLTNMNAYRQGSHMVFETDHFSLYVIVEEGHQHDYQKVVTAPDCTEDGFTTYTCGCGSSYVDDKVSALGHSYDKGKVSTKPTCMTEGVKTYTCSACGDTKTESVEKDPKNHSFTKYESDKNATCKKDGTKTAKCDYGCGKTDTVTDRGSKLGHKYQGDKCIRCGVTRWNPDTGDKIMIAVATMVISGGVLLILIRMRKKRK